MQQFFDLRSVHSRGSKFDSDTARTKRFGLEAILVEFLRDFREDRLLCWCQFNQHRHEQPLALNFLYSSLLQYFLKQYTLMGHMLVDDPQAFSIDRENER